MTTSTLRPVTFQTGLVRRRRSPLRRAIVVLGAILVVVAVAIAVASWFLSSLLINPQRKLVSDNIETLAVRSGEVVLARTTASDRLGVYGLDWASGHAIAGAIVSSTSSTVTRRLGSLTGHLTPHKNVGIDPDVWTSDPRRALGIPFKSFTFPDPLGAMPAWLVSGRSSTWVIFVHGIDGSRAGGLRPLSTLHSLGLTTLLIDYRNDAGAPASPDGHIQLGMTEWNDLNAAARWALSHGARRLVLYGDSMGGAIVTRFMHLSPFAGKVVALILDAPVLNWSGVIDHEASRLNVPFMSIPVKWMLDVRIGPEWGALDELAQSHTFHLPILLFQGEDDTLVPPAESAAFAQTAPGPVTYVPVPGVGHIESWNADPAAYDARLRTFLMGYAPPRPRAG